MVIHAGAPAHPMRRGSRVSLPPTRGCGVRRVRSWGDEATRPSMTTKPGRVRGARAAARCLRPDRRSRLPRLLTAAFALLGLAVAPAAGLGPSTTASPVSTAGPAAAAGPSAGTLTRTSVGSSPRWSTGESARSFPGAVAPRPTARSSEPARPAPASRRSPSRASSSPSRAPFSLSRASSFSSRTPSAASSSASSLGSPLSTVRDARTTTAARHLGERPAPHASPALPPRHSHVGVPSRFAGPAATSSSRPRTVFSHTALGRAPPPPQVPT